MNHHLETLGDVYAALEALRRDPKSRRRFPKEVWGAIIRLTHTYPVGQVCTQLKIPLVHFKRKMQQLQKAPLENVEFQEISCHMEGFRQTNTVIIELLSDSGLRARIQGTSDCLNCLSALFKG